MIQENLLEEVSNLLYVDHTLCTGCGVCVDVCPTGAISLDKKEDISTIDLALCNKCLVCLDACPNGAIQRDTSPASVPAMKREAVEGEIIRREMLPIPAARRPLTFRQPGRLAALAGMALTAAGNWLLPRAADALVGTIERRLAGRSTLSAPRLRPQSMPLMRRMGRGRGGQLMRHRRHHRGK
jgi:formate hydrogenlyase subunit 6/NADH:ubiquinone oxidoreductase subunit I